MKKLIKNLQLRIFYNTKNERPIFINLFIKHFLLKKQPMEQIKNLQDLKIYCLYKAKIPQSEFNENFLHKLLFLFIYKKDLPMCKWIINDLNKIYKFQINVCWENNIYVQMACFNGYLEIIKYLLENYGDKIDVSADNNCSLQWACKKGHLDIVKYLIENHGDKINIGEVINLAINCAFKEGHLEVVKYLVKNHTNTHIKEAYEKGNLEEFGNLLEALTQKNL